MPFFSTLAHVVFFSETWEFEKTAIFTKIHFFVNTVRIWPQGKAWSEKNSICIVQYMLRVETDIYEGGEGS